MLIAATLHSCMHVDPIVPAAAYFPVVCYNDVGNDSKVCSVFFWFSSGPFHSLRG